MLGLVSEIKFNGEAQVIRRKDEKNILEKKRHKSLVKFLYLQDSYFGLTFLRHSFNVLKCTRNCQTF